MSHMNNLHCRENDPPPAHPDDMDAGAPAGHTPLPWGYRDRDFRGQPSEFDLYLIGDVHEGDDGELCSVGIGIVKGNATAGGIPLANARLICLAVNAHADLVMGVTAMLEADRLQGHRLERDFPGTVAMARAALAKAKG